MKRVGTAIENICFFLLMLVMVSCIHTFPSTDSVDPTLLEVGVDLSLDIDWTVIDYPLSKADDSKPINDYRLIIELSRNGSYVGRYEYFMTQKEYERGNIQLKIPFEFRAVGYKASIWLDCVDALTHNSLHYDAKYLSYINRMDHHISWDDEKACVFGTTDINLQAYRDKWGSKVLMPIHLKSPMGRFRIIATDMPMFSEYVAESIAKGETYSVCVSFEDNVAQAFNANDGVPVDYLDNPEYYFPLSKSALIADSPEVVSGMLFAGERGSMVSAKVVIYNSARVIVSKSPTITFPVERGKITVVTGDVLTEYYTNTINVNNIWDGEIVIEI